MKGITINIPVYNEEEIIIKNTEALITYMDSLGVEYEILIVDNGSTDRTAELGKELQNKYPQIRFFHIPERGVGAAFKKAATEARYEHIISIDMDLSVDLGFIRDANTLLEDYSLVIGSKIMGSQKRSLLRKLGSKTYISLARWLLGLKFSDYSIGAKGFKRDFVINHLAYIDRHTNYVLNLSYCAIKKGLKVIEIPTRCVDYRKSRFNLLKEGFYRFFLLFKLALTKKIDNNTRESHYC